MATVPGGIFDTTVITEETGASISNLITDLGYSENVFTQSTVTGATVYQTVDTSQTNSILVMDTNLFSTTTVVGAISSDVTIVGGSGGGIAIVGSNTLGTGLVVQGETDNLLDLRMPTTSTGQKVTNVIFNAIADLTSTITGATGSLAVTDLLGGDSSTTLDLSNKSGSGTILVVNAGGSGANVNLDGYKNVVTTGSGKFTITDNAGANIQMVTGTTTVTGGSGSDSIIASYGNHTVSGGAGADNFGMRLGSGSDTVAGAVRPKVNLVVSDFSVAQGDKLHFELPGITNFDQFVAYLASAKDVGNDVVAVTKGGDTITLTGVKLADINANMFTFG